MGSKVTFDYSKADAFINAHEMESMKKITEAAKAELLGREGAGNDFLGWIDLPVDYDKEEFERIKKAAAKIQSDSEVLVVIGIGGSYLGARAAIEFLGHSFYNVVSKEIRKTPEIYYCGNSLSGRRIQGGSANNIGSARQRLGVGASADNGPLHGIDCQNTDQIHDRSDSFHFASMLSGH